MSLEHSPARSRCAFTIAEFCDAYRISRVKLYQLWRDGLGPRYMCVGKKRLIAVEAGRDWVTEGEARSLKIGKPVT